MGESGRLTFTITLDDQGKPVIADLDKIKASISQLEGTAVPATTGMSKGFADTAKSMALGAAAALGIGVGISQLTRFTKAAILESWKFEQQQSKLDVILGRSGENIVETNKSIAAFADKMEYLTGVNDDQTRSLEILARQYEIQNDRIDGAIKSSIALTQIGGNLEGNLHAVANAYNGNWRELGALIPAIRAANNESERMDILQRKVAEGIDIATAAMNTHAGSWQRLGNMGKDILKGAGDFIMGVVDAADEKLFGMRSLVVENNRVILAEEEKFMSALEIMKARAGIALRDYGKPSLNQLGFIDIESDLATSEAKQKTLDDEATAYKKITDAADAYSKSLGFLNNTAIKELIDNTAILMTSLKNYGGQLEGNQELQTKVWEGAIKMANDYIQTGKAVPKALQEWIDKAHELNTVQAMTQTEFKDFFGILPPGFSALGNAFDIAFKHALIYQQLMVAIATRTIPDFIKIGQVGAGEYKSDADKIVKSWQEVEAQFQAVQRAVGYVDDMFSALGINSKGVTSQISNALGAAGSFSSGMASLNKEGGSLTDILAGVTSIVGAVTAAITVAIAVVKLFAGDGIGEAIKREQVLIGVNKELIKQIKDLAKTMGDTHVATSVMLNDVIDQADVTVANFDTYAARIEEILSDYDRHTLSMGDTTKEIGDSFTSLISKAKELGTEGSASMLKLMDDLASRGIRVKEIQDYINANWKMGLEGYKKYLEGDFSKATIGVFEYLLAYEKKVGANQALVDGVEGITQALIGMSNITELTEEEFDNFELAGRDAYDKLQAQGFSSKESLMQLQPMLSRMIFLQKEYGLQIDDSTQALIDKAKAEGIDLTLVKSQDELFGDMADSLKELVDIFKNAFPKAVDDSIEALKKFNRTPIDDKTPYTPGQPNPKLPYEEPAAAGWQGWVTGPKRFLAGEGSEPEYISITPQSKMRGSDSVPGGRTTQINITLAGTITPESAADAIMTAYRNNTRGLRSLLEN